MITEVRLDAQNRPSTRGASRLSVHTVPAGFAAIAEAHPHRLDHERLCSRCISPAGGGDMTCRIEPDPTNGDALTLHNNRYVDLVNFRSQEVMPL